MVFVYDAIIQYPNTERREAATQLHYVKTILVLKQTGKKRTEHIGKRTVNVKIHVKRGPNYLH
jgi:hypothetical protein